MTYVGRLAPSPTGAQHVGNARTFLVAWLACRSAGGKLWLRIEDLDTPRTKEGATEQALLDLKWLGLEWDELEFGKSFTTQSDREMRYAQVLDELKEKELVYPCTCTRSDIERVASAPHESVLDGTVYPGTCQNRTAQEFKQLDKEGVAYAWRFRMPAGMRSFRDDKFGLQTLDAQKQLGDFVVARSYGVTAYQLAVVVDDHDSGVNHVVRGNDLIYSTYRQMAIYEAMQWSTPCWLHLPLVTGPDGKRLAKRHGDTRLATYREQGVAPELILGYLAKTLGILSGSESRNAAELLSIVSCKEDWLTSMPRENQVFLGKFD